MASQNIEEKRANFLRRTVDPENIMRITQWHVWTSLMKEKPDLYQVRYSGGDFFLFGRTRLSDQFIPIKKCESYRPKPQLKVV